MLPWITSPNRRAKPLMASSACSRLDGMDRPPVSLRFYLHKQSHTLTESV
jgi:hypothetical protein